MEWVLDRPCPGWIGRWTQARSRRTSSVVIKSLDFRLNMMKYLYGILSNGLPWFDLFRKTCPWWLRGELTTWEARRKIGKSVTRLFQQSQWEKMDFCVHCGVGEKCSHCFKVVRIGLAYGVVRGWESRITSRIKSWDSLLMYPMAARWCCPIGWPAASASGIDWGKWPYRWALKFWGRQRSPREYSLKRWGPRAEPWSIRGSQHRVHCEEEENPASLVFPERKWRKSSKEGVIRCIKCCQEVRLRWG